METLASFLASREIAVLKVDLATIQRAVDVFREHDFLSFTDATTCVLLDSHGIKEIATFDGDFAKLGFNVVRS